MLLHARFVVRNARSILVATAVVSLVAALQLVNLSTGALRLGLDASVDSMLPRSEPARVFYDRIRDIFGNDETVLVALAGDDDLFTSAHLERIKRLTRRFEEISGVHHVVSLANALNIRGADDELDLRPFIDEVPEDPQGLAAIRHNVLDDPIYTGSLVSADGRVTAFVIYLRNLSEREFIALGVGEKIREVAQRESGDAVVWVTGGPHVKAEMTRLMLIDLTVTVPLAALAMALVALLSFRTGRGVLIPFTTVGLALLWTMGLLAAFGGQLNMVTVAAPPILLVVGFAYSVHILSAYYDALAPIGQAQAKGVGGAVEGALEHVALPVLITGMTTAAGFFSLMLSPLESIQQFGGLLGAGILATTAISLSYAPAMLETLPLPRRMPPPRRTRPGDALLDRIAHFDVKHRLAILMTGAVVAAISLAGMTQIRVGTDFVGNFRADNQVRLDFEAVNARLEGSSSIYVILEAPDKDAFKEPQNLREIWLLQEWLEAQPEIGGTTSVVDYVRTINRALRNNAPEALRIPNSKQLIAQLLFFGANDELHNFVDASFRTASVLVRSREIDSARVNALTTRIETRLAQLPAHLRATVTGNSVLVSRTNDEIALGQALSLSTAFVVILVVLTWLFASLRIGLIALIPNVLPVLVYFGVLGLSGVKLNTTTGLVACLVLGIAVDDTIHVMAGFRDSSRKTKGEERRVAGALRLVGRPVTYTTLALCIGFLVLTFSDMQNQVEFGALAAFTLAFAWLVDMTFTPALIARLQILPEAIPAPASGPLGPPPIAASVAVVAGTTQMPRANQVDPTAKTDPGSVGVGSRS